MPGRNLLFQRTSQRDVSLAGLLRRECSDCLTGPTGFTSQHRKRSLGPLKPQRTHPRGGRLIQRTASVRIPVCQALRTPLTLPLRTSPATWQDPTFASPGCPASALRVSLEDWALDNHRDPRLCFWGCHEVSDSSGGELETPLCQD